MKSDWTQQFRGKFEEYLPDIPIPPFAIKQRRNRKTVFWASVIAVAASISVFVFWAAFRPDSGASVFTGHLIGETTPQIEYAYDWEVMPINLSRRSVGLFNLTVSDLSQQDVVVEVVDPSVKESDVKTFPAKGDTVPELSATKDSNIFYGDDETVDKGRKRLSTRILLAPGPARTLYESHPGIGLSDSLTSDMDISSKWSFKAGINIGYEFLPGLSVETGLVYNNHIIYLRYKDSENKVFETDCLKLHYLGIPLKLDIGLARTDKLSVYGSLGVETSWLIKGNVKETKGSPMLISLTGGIGLSYDFAPAWSVYMEPSISYNYMPSGQVAYYANYPFGFNIAMGLRLEL